MEKEQGQELPIDIVVNPKGEQLVCPVCKSRKIKQDPKWEDNECLNCKKIWTNKMKKLNKNDVKCEVCDSENVVEYPHLGFNCNDCNPIYR